MWKPVFRCKPSPFRKLSPGRRRTGRVGGACRNADRRSLVVDCGLEGGARQRVLTDRRLGSEPTRWRQGCGPMGKSARAGARSQRSISARPRPCKARDLAWPALKADRRTALESREGREAVRRHHPAFSDIAESTSRAFPRSGPPEYFPR